MSLHFDKDLIVHKIGFMIIDTDSVADSSFPIHATLTPLLQYWE